MGICILGLQKKGHLYIDLVKITYELINAQFNNYLNTKLDDITEVEYYRTVFQ